jgi:hypothetical protein
MPEARKRSTTQQNAKNRPSMDRAYDVRAQNQLDGLRLTTADEPRAGKEHPAGSRAAQVSLVEKLIDFLQTME